MSRKLQHEIASQACYVVTLTHVHFSIISHERHMKKERTYPKSSKWIDSQCQAEKWRFLNGFIVVNDNGIKQRPLTSVEQTKMHLN